MADIIITVVGSSNTDLVVRVPHTPLPGETLLGGDVQRHQGGKGANQAVAAHRLGAEVWFIGCLGDDNFGDAAAALLMQEGLRLDHVKRVKGISSGIAFIAVAASGQNTIIVAPGANAHLTPVNIEQGRAAISSSQLVVAQLEIPLPSVQYALALARTAGVRTLLNPAPAQTLSDTLMALVDVLVCNETEAEMLTQQAVTDVASASAAAQILRTRGPALVVITLGGNGCIVADDTTVHIPAFVVPVVDTTAAGDAFIGALAYRLALGDAPGVAVRYATAAAALSVGVAGAQPSLPTGLQVETFLLRHK